MRSDREADPAGEAGGASLRDDGRGGGGPGLSPRLLAIAIALVVLLVDQLTKAWALAALADAPIPIIDDFLQLRVARNSGASFSTFTGSGPLIAVVAIGVVVLIVVVLGDAGHRIEAISLGLVLGGALGNLADRLFRGAGLLDGSVVDWIDFSFFPTFNLADTAITIGIALLLVHTLSRR